MVTIQNINATILSGKFTDDQLNSIWHAVKYAKAQLGKKNLYTVKAGDRVRFSNKDGSAVVGTVLKKGTKYVKVLEGRTTWRVPANMLEVA